jgi:hypothetical protein
VRIGQAYKWDGKRICERDEGYDGTKWMKAQQNGIEGALIT